MQTSPRPALSFDEQNLWTAIPVSCTHCGGYCSCHYACSTGYMPCCYQFCLRRVEVKTCRGPRCPDIRVSNLVSMQR